MKKSIKYAGIAAATLLAVAPVAAPVVSNVTTAQAAVSDTDANLLDQDITDFKGQFADLTKTDAITNAVKANTYFGAANAGKLSHVLKDANVTPLLSKALDSQFAKLADQDATVYFTAQDASGKTYNGISVGQTAEEVAKTMGLNTRMPMTINVHLKYNSLNSAEGTFETVKSFNINNPKGDTNNELTALNATFTSPISVAKDSQTLATQLVDTDSVKLTDQDGKSTAVSNIQFGNGYFHTYAAAMDAAKADGYDVTKTQGDTGITDKFTDAGTYYQVVTYTAKANSALASMLQAYKTNPSKYTVFVNGKEASAGYDFTSAATTDGTAETISFVRTVKVSNSTDSWKVSDASGVVTTKTAHQAYTLVDGDNNTITNRALGANTAWKTDKVRVNQDGVTQYRVATNEWINADDVVKSDAVVNNGLTDIKAASGVATLTKPAGYVMSLFGDDAKVLDRGLASGTAWRVDKTAKDAAGNTYYRVATGEWLQAGEGVSFK